MNVNEKGDICHLWEDGVKYYWIWKREGLL